MAVEVIGKGLKIQNLNFLFVILDKYGRKMYDYVELRRQAFVISYNNLWKSLIDRGMKRTDLIREARISSSTLANMGKNQSVSLETIDRICDALDCGISDVVTIEKSKGKIKTDARRIGLHKGSKQLFWIKAKDLHIEETHKND